MSEHILFIGNPGVGKSTFLNGLVGQAKFKSGISYGSGLTQRLKWVTKNGIKYGDTPGLADIKNQSKFANSIEKGLKRGGSYKIIFMVTEEAGRIHPADVATMNLIGNSLEHCDFKYGIILNKLSEDMYDLLCNDEKSKRIMLNAFNQTGTSKRKPTSDIWLYAYDEALVDKSDIVPNLSEGVINFIHSIPPTIIDASKVQPIQVNRYDDLVSDYKNKMTEINRLENIIQKLETEKLQLTLEQQRDVNNYRAEFDKLRRDLEHNRYRGNGAAFAGGGAAIAGAIASELAPVAISIAFSTLFMGVPLPLF